MAKSSGVDWRHQRRPNRNYLFDQSTLIRHFRPSEVHLDDPRTPSYTRRIKNNRFRDLQNHQEFYRETPSFLACGEAGSAPLFHSGGQGFESPWIHRIAPVIIEIAGVFVPVGYRSLFDVTSSIKPCQPARIFPGAAGFTARKRAAAVSRLPRESQS